MRLIHNTTDMTTTHRLFYVGDVSVALLSSLTTPARGFLFYKWRLLLVVQTPMTSLDIPQYAVDADYRIAVSDYPSQMLAIPPSRMFTIKEALQKYRDKVGQDAPVYDASQGDGGASLPGVPKAILERANELQIEHGTGYDKPFGNASLPQGCFGAILAIYG